MSTIGQRFRESRKAAGLTQEVLAGKCGVSRAAVAQWEGDVTKPSFDHLQKAAETLGVSLSWLTSGEQAAPSSQRLVPVIDYASVGKWAHVTDPYEPGGMEIITTDLDVGGRAFALIITGDSMLPEFRRGDKIIIDPEVSPKPGDFVIAKLEGDDEATFKKYRPRGADMDDQPVIELVPLNEDWPTQTISTDNPGHIIGTLVEQRRYRRRRNTG